GSHVRVIGAAGRPVEEPKGTYGAYTDHGRQGVGAPCSEEPGGGRAGGAGGAQKHSSMGRRLARKDPRDLIDRIDPADGGQDRVEVAGVGQLEVEVERGHPVGGGVGGAGDDVDVVVGEDFGHVAEELGAVERLDL